MSKKPVPPAPPGWNKTATDLSAEMERGERKRVTYPEIVWAQEYERSQIPKDVRFPSKGDIYEVVENMTVHYMTVWGAPFTGGGEGVLKKGDRVVVDQDPADPKPVSVYARAVDYDSLEVRIVPASDRTNPKYSGFCFSFKTVELNRKFKLVRGD